MKKYSTISVHKDMKTSKEIEEILRINKKELKEVYPLKGIGIFGSYAKSNQTQDSDIDILVEFKKPVGLITFLKLENDLTKLLGVKVDLVMKKALKPYIGKRILKEIQYVI